MSKIKNILIDLQNEFGENLENMPIDFSLDDFLNNQINKLNNFDSSK
jgi:hypothetical protein